MVNNFNADDANVSYRFDEFFYARADVDGVDGYKWRLDLPIDDPDPTVRITDNDKTFEFTEVQQIPSAENTTIPDKVVRAVERTEI